MDSGEGAVWPLDDFHLVIPYLRKVILTRFRSYRVTEPTAELGVG